MLLKILASRNIGMANYADYFVEVPAERRTVFLGDYPTSRYFMHPVDLPLPPMLYKLRGPSEKGITKSVTCSMSHAWGLERRGGQKLFYLPFLNYMHQNGGFSICSNRATINPDQAKLPIEEVLSGVLSMGWATPMRYHLGGPKEAWEWLGFENSRYSIDWRQKYPKWEALSVAEARKYPWGKHEFKFTVKKLIAG